MATLALRRILPPLCVARPSRPRDGRATPGRAALLALVLSLTAGAVPGLAQSVVPADLFGEIAVADSADLGASVEPPGAPDASVLGPLRATLDAALDEALATSGDTTEVIREAPLPLTVFGYYRLFMYGRNIDEPYPNLEPFERAYGVGDGYREPMLSLTVLGRPSGRSSFGSELFVYTPYEGTEDENNTISLNLGINFYGNFRTEAGNFGVRVGGIHWYNLSPFTIGVYQVLDRYSIFDRTPWEGVNGVTKYDNYFRTGQSNPGDARWNFQAFQGLILNGAELPGGFAFDAFVGKTQPNGGLPNAITEPSETVGGGGEAGDVPTYTGFSGDARVLPSFITGGRLQRSFGANSVAYNGIYSYRTLDSLAATRREYQVHTGSFDATLGPVNLTGELGASRFQSPDYTSKWGEALMVRGKTPAATTVFPLDVQLYQVGRHFYNENGEIATGNNPNLRGEPRCDVAAGDGGVGGAITQVNQLAHNRRGVNVNTGWQGGPAGFAVGWGTAHELAPTTSELSYVHRINGLALSRIYNPFPENAVCATNFGPLQRQYSFFRGVFERVQTTDVEPVTGLPLNRKWYHAVDLQGKLGGEVLGTPAYLFYLGSFGSANPSFQVVPTDDDTYLFVQYHELDLYVGVWDNFVLTGYLGLENARGGQFTERDATSGLPRDQHARGIGVGFDWTLAPNAGLYVRHRWMDFEDRSFAIDTYSGRELTFELKIFI